MGSTQSLLVRRYRAGDLDSVIAVFQGAIRNVASRDYTPAQVAAWSAVDRAEWAPWRLSRPAWVAEIDGAVAGFTDLEPDGHLDMMFVHPERQGMGVATTLLAALEAYAVENGIRRLFAEASITARPFFARRGFTVIRRDLVEQGGESFTIYHIEKRHG